MRKDILAFAWSYIFIKLTSKRYLITNLSFLLVNPSVRCVWQNVLLHIFVNILGPRDNLRIAFLGIWLWLTFF